MSIISFFSGNFCRQEAVIADIMASTGYRLVKDKDVVAKAAELSELEEGKILRALSARTSVFNQFTREKEYSVACLKLALAEMLADDKFIIAGFTGLLAPGSVDHVLRICLAASPSYRIGEAVRQGVQEKEAVRMIRKNDEDCAAWVDLLFAKQDPWDASLYDLLLPMDKVGIEKAGSLIEENLLKGIVQRTAESVQKVTDFQLAAKVEVELIKEGHGVDVATEEGRVSLTINKHVLLLNRLKEELKTIALNIPGVAAVEIRVGKDYHQSDIYRRHDFEKPSKVLLVDDERELVQTLSERLLMRDMGSAVAYNGQSALEIVGEDDPEVMIIDLKMPGLSGLDVLKKVKETRPEIEVIILTGHGTRDDRRLCMELGAFAYLQKPVDIDELSETLKRAHAKFRGNK